MSQLICIKKIFNHRQEIVFDIDDIGYYFDDFPYYIFHTPNINWIKGWYLQKEEVFKYFALNIKLKLKRLLK